MMSENFPSQLQPSINTDKRGHLQTRFSKCILIQLQWYLQVVVPSLAGINARTEISYYMRECDDVFSLICWKLKLMVKSVQRFQQILRKLNLHCRAIWWLIMEGCNEAPKCDPNDHQYPCGHQLQGSGVTNLVILCTIKLLERKIPHPSQYGLSNSVKCRRGS